MAFHTGDRAKMDDEFWQRDPPAAGRLSPGSIAPVALDALLARQPVAPKAAPRSRAWVYGGAGAAAALVGLLALAIGSSGPGASAHAAAAAAPPPAQAAAPVVPPATPPAVVSPPAPVDVVAAAPSPRPKKTPARPVRRPARTGK